jgi:hypothetical protein
VGGDSWFGSATTVVEVIRRFCVNSTWIIKKNQSWFPMKALFAMLKAWFRPAGHWVSIAATIPEAKLIAIA